MDRKKKKAGVAILISDKIDFQRRAIKRDPGRTNDGSVGRHTAPPRTTRIDRTSNGKEVRHQGNKK